VIEVKSNQSRRPDCTLQSTAAAGYY